MVTRYGIAEKIGVVDATKALLRTAFVSRDGAPREST
jgi:hypothetical protein